MDQFSCPDCEKRFPTHLTMRIHKQEVHDFLDFQNSPQCMFCKLKFKSSYIGTHVQVCPVRALKQEYNDKWRRDNNNNKKNKKDNKKTKLVAIEKNGFVDDLNDHDGLILFDLDQVKVEPGLDFGCQFCNFLAGSQLTLDEHCRATHTPADYRRCIYCGMSFENEELAQHLTTCLQDSLKIKCSKCQLAFLTYDLCMDHQTSMHSNANLEISKSKKEMKSQGKDKANSLKLILKLKPKPTTTTTTTTTNTSVLKMRNGSKNGDFDQLMTSSPSSTSKKERKSSNYPKISIDPSTSSAGCKLNNSTTTAASSKKKYAKKATGFGPGKMKARKMKFNCPAANCRKKYEARGLMQHLAFAHQWKKSEGSGGGPKPKKNIICSEICPYPGCKKKLQENHLKLHMSLNHCNNSSEDNGLENNGNNFGFTKTSTTYTDIGMELETNGNGETVQASKAIESGFVSCRLCKAVVISMSSHIRRHHNPAFNNACNSCGKRFLWPNDLARHLQIHKILNTYTN